MSVDKNRIRKGDMMNEIIKLYENAGVKPKKGKEITIDPTTDKENYHNVFYGYPEFTAEKQLEVIKWLIKTKITGARMLNYDKKTKKYYYIIFHREELIESELFDFEEALACLVNNLWQDLTEEEKQQIKEILE